MAEGICNCTRDISNLMYNGLDGKFNLKYNVDTKSVTLTFDKIPNFESFLFWLDLIQVRQNVIESKLSRLKNDK